MWLQLTCAFESLALQAVWTWPRAWIDYKQTQDQPRSQDGMKVCFHRIRTNPPRSHRIAFVHNLSQKMCFISPIPCCLLHSCWLWNRTAVGKSWNECLIIKTLSTTSMAAPRSASRWVMWEERRATRCNLRAAFPGQPSGWADKAVV